jgi:hypothetical protein
MGKMNDDTRTETFATPAPVRLDIQIPKGRIEVAAEETAETRIELVAINGDPSAREWIAEAEVTQQGDTIIVRGRRNSVGWLGLGGSIAARVTAPLGSAAALTNGAGRISTTGRLADVKARSGAGAICIAEAADVNARSGAGDIEIASASGSVDAKAGSGRVSLGTVGRNARVETGAGRTKIESVVGEARIATGSGDIEVERSGDLVDAFTPAGRVRVGRADHGQVRAKTIAGEVAVGVAGGPATLLDISTMSGRVTSELDAGGPPADGETRLELHLNTLSGNVHVSRA